MVCNQYKRNEIIPKRRDEKFGEVELSLCFWLLCEISFMISLSILTLNEEDMTTNKDLESWLHFHKRTTILEGCLVGYKTIGVRMTNTKGVHNWFYSTLSLNLFSL